MAHVGQKALEAMERFVAFKAALGKSNKTASKPPLEWLSQREWQLCGKPFYTERELTSNPFSGFSYRYHVPSKTTGAERPAKFASVLERAKWLWLHLPAEIKGHSQLLVTRENRSATWNRSLANPAWHGWRKASNKTAASKPYISSWTPESFDTENFYLDGPAMTVPDSPSSSPSPQPSIPSYRAAMLGKLQKAKSALEEK